MMDTHDDVKTSTIALVGFLGAILTFAIIVLLTVIYYRTEARIGEARLRQEEQLQQPPTELRKLLADQRARLVEYRWVDREQQIVVIPIQRAMDLVVRELSSGIGGKQQEQPQQPSAKSDDRAPLRRSGRAGEPDQPPMPTSQNGRELAPSGGARPHDHIEEQADDR